MNQNTTSVEQGDTSIAVSRVIPSDPQALFDVVADPTMHHVIDGSGSVRGTRGPARKLALGDRFTTSMRIGVPYMISNKVVEFDEPRRIAWAHVGGWCWRYTFEPVDGATRVTETFDWSSAFGGPLGRTYVKALGWPERNAKSITRTLERLDAYITNKFAK